MKLQYLGTAAAEGVPALFCECPMCEMARQKAGKNFRARSGAVLNDRLMIDFPPDAYSTALRTGVRLCDITDIIFTHSHRDHCCVSELAFRSEPAYCIRSGREPLHLYGNMEVQQKILPEQQKLVGKGAITYTFLEPFVRREIAGVGVTPLKAFHNPPENAYVYLLEQDGKTLLYAHDTGWMPEETFAFLKGRYLDFVSLDCTQSFLPWTGRTHMGFIEDVKTKEKLFALGCADEKTRWVCNHFSHNSLRRDNIGVPADHEALEAEAQKYGFTASYDGRIFTI